jgi:CubicO group peptidase (beta-lactamase class C family)
MLSNTLKLLSCTLLTFVIGVSLFVFRPWADHQGWRLFHKSNPFISRVHTHSNWHLVSPYAVLKASENPRRYQRELTDLSDITYEYKGETYTAADYFSKANLVGLMVLYDNKVVVENYDQGVSADTTYMIMSSTKSFTSTMVGIAVKDGKIESLDDRVEKYATQYEGTAYGETPIKHVLMMSSGIDFSHINAYAPNGRVRLYFDLWVRRMSFDQKTAALTRSVESGTEFVYLATDTHVLSRVVEGAYGGPYIDVVQEKLWSPGGFSSDAQWSVDGDGNPFGQMALSVTLQDFAHFGQLQLEDLVLDGRKVVSDDWLDMVQNAQAPFQEPRIMEDGSYIDGYSLQWWLPVGYDQEFIAKGAGNQYMYVNKKDNYVIAQFSAEAPVSKKEEIAFYRAVGKYFKELH